MASSLSMTRRPVVIALLLIFLTALSPAPSLAVVQAEDDAKAFIEGLADQAIQALTVPGATEEDKVKRFRELLREHFAVEDIGEWVLGRHWARASEAERAEYLKLFEDWVVVTYVRRFESYSGETLNVSRAVLRDGSLDVIVDSEIVRPAVDPIHVAWRVRDYDNELRIVDVIVEGVSMSQTQRADFGSIIRRSDGEITGLLNAMRQTLER